MKDFRKLIESVDAPFVLAPLAGVTDSVFRYICARQGAGICYTEMISAKGLHYGSANTEDLLDMWKDKAPVGIQLFGSEPDIMAEAADKLEDLPNVLIDINMGCPVPKIVRNGEGSALLLQPELASRIVMKLSEATRKPVSVKMRAGFSEVDIDSTVEFAKLMEQSGASAITVHARSREQYYSGTADWEAIRAVKRALKIPVIGNGDVFSAEDAMRMLEFTGCDLVMIARGAMGNPWIFREAHALYKGLSKPERPSVEEVIALIEEHARMQVEEKGEKRGILQMRKHASWYSKGIKGASALRRRINSAESLAELMETTGELQKLRQSE